MRYIEISIDAPEKELDGICDTLTAMGAEGFLIESDSDFQSFLENNHRYWDYVDDELMEHFAGVSRVKLYLSEDEEGLALRDRILAAFPAARAGFTADQDWENSWRENYQPIPVGERLVVVPSWEEAPADGRVPLRLEPGLTFGTGSHATTRLCLTAMEPYTGEGKKVLDLGCGSGILGIGALVLGCDSCVGADIDPKSADAAMDNAALNHIGADRMRVYSGDITCDAGLRRELGSGYHIVLANIVADVIIALSPFVRSFMAEDGVFICSGIIEDRWQEVENSLRAAGFQIIDHTHEDEWHCFLCK